MLALRLVIILGVFVVAFVAPAKQPAREQKGSDARVLTPWQIDIEAALRINSNPLMRTIVCRVPFMDFTPEAIAKATGVPRTRVIRAVSELRKLGLVKMNVNDQGQQIIRPATDKARTKMRRWVYYWCTKDDECKVVH